LFFFILAIVSLPLLPVAALLGLLASSLFLGVMMLGFIFVATYLFLAVPGIILNGRPLLRAVAESVRLVHRNVLQTVNLLLLIVLISSGMNLLWHLADDGSWLTAISIAGHAFVSTALAGAIFIYYRDRFAVLSPASR
jgi:membrane-anchored glycerophosphoryl diester phosphodiesterase (GDPDase)